MSIVSSRNVKRIGLLALILVAAGVLAVLLITPGGRAQVNVGAEPSMSKGAASAKVTIVEFSDYQ